MLFGHRYDIRATVELENGEVYKVKCPMEARFVSEGEILAAVKKEIKLRLGSPVKKVLEFYDASG